MNRKYNKGITLIALVITIIVLLILATVSIVSITGQRGIVSKANTAKVQTSHASVKEALIIAYNEYQLELETMQANTLIPNEMTEYPKNDMIAQAGQSMLAGDDAAGLGVSEKVNVKVYTFKQYCIEKKYCDETGKINVKNLVGQDTGFGKGTGATDVYKLVEDDQMVEINKNILVQAGQSMLAQANQSEQGVLNLLQAPNVVKLEPQAYVKPCMVVQHNIIGFNGIETQISSNWILNYQDKNANIIKLHEELYDIIGYTIPQDVLSLLG